MSKLEGKLITTWSSGDAIVLECQGNNRHLVRFINTGNEGSFDTSAILDGRIKDNCKPIFLGIGYTGNGKYTSKDVLGKATTEYTTWSNMMRRCYSVKYQDTQPTYKGCTVCEEWHNFQVFAEWYNLQENCHKQGFELDKDLLVKGNKIYSKETCCLLPRDINMAIKIAPKSGIWKRANGKYLVRGKLYLNDRVVEKSLGTFENYEDALSRYGDYKISRIKEMISKFRKVLPEHVLRAMELYTV